MLQVSDVRRSNKFPQFGDIPLDEIGALTDFLQKRCDDFAFSRGTVGPLWYFHDEQLRIYYSAIPLPDLQFMEFRFRNGRFDDFLEALKLAREDLDE